MIVDNTSMLSDVVNWWLARRSSKVKGTQVGTRLEPVFSKPAPVQMSEPLLKGENIIDWAREFRKVHGRDPKWPEVRASFPEIPKTTAWRRVKSA